MNDEVVKAHQELATRNSMIAVQKVEKVESDLTARINHLEALLANHQVLLDELQKNYNLLLTKNFNGGSTS